MNRDEMTSPDVSLPSTPGPWPADASPSAGVSSFSPPPAISQVIIATPPAFYNQGEVARYLNCSTTHLRNQARKIPLFHPSYGKRKQGTPAQYYIEHIRIIEAHLLNPDTYPADVAYKDWLDIRESMPREHMERAKQARRNAAGTRGGRGLK